MAMVHRGFFPKFRMAGSKHVASHVEKQQPMAGVCGNELYLLARAQWATYVRYMPCSTGVASRDTALHSKWYRPDQCSVEGIPALYTHLAAEA